MSYDDCILCLLLNLSDVDTFEERDDYPEKAVLRNDLVVVQDMQLLLLDQLRLRTLTLIPSSPSSLW
jgi:hypothetical protein